MNLHRAARAVQGAWRRVEPHVARRRALALLVLAALAVYWVESLGWPFQRGRDAWDYFTYYLTFFDADTPFREVMLFRTPVAPFLLGIPLSIGGATLLEIVMSLFYTVSIVAWSLAALSFSRLAAVLTALLLLAFPGYAQLYHEASSDGIACFLFSLFALAVVRTCLRPSTRRFALLGVLAVVLALNRPAYLVLLGGCVVPLVLAAPWRRRLLWGLAYLAAGAALAGGYMVFNQARYGDLTFSRLALGLDSMGPFDANAGPASRRLARIVERQVLSLPEYRRYHVTIQTYFRDSSNYEGVRLLGIDDRLEGIGAGYRLLRQAQAEYAARHPKRRTLASRLERYARILWRYASGATYREIRLKPATWLPVRQAYRDSEGKLMPEPAALPPPVQAVSYGTFWCANDDFARCTLADPSVAYSNPQQARRYAEIMRTIRSWDAPLGRGRPVAWIARQLTRVAHWYPPAWVWLALGLVALPFRRAVNKRVLAAVLGLALLVVVGHATLGYVRPYAIPVYPVPILFAAAMAAGRRALREPEPVAAGEAAALALEDARPV
jgi:hypothetical protein